MSPSIKQNQEKSSHLHLLHHLQLSHPQAQIALLQFKADTCSIGIARWGVPIHTEKFKNIGLDHLLNTVLTHANPDALQAEQAIERIEEAIMPAQLDLRQFQVFTADPEALTLLKWVQTLNQQQHKILHLDMVEACFNLYAEAAVGDWPISTLPSDTKLWAYLILLRETMHHLYIEQIHVLST